VGILKRDQLTNDDYLRDQLSERISNRPSLDQMLSTGYILGDYSMDD